MKVPTTTYDAKRRRRRRHKYEGVNNKVRREATTMTEDKGQNKHRDCCKLFFLFRGRGGKRKSKTPKTREGDDNDGGLARSVRCSRGLSLLNGLVRRPPKQARARDTDDLFCLLEYTDLVSVKKTVACTRALRLLITLRWYRPSGRNFTTPSLDV